MEFWIGLVLFCFFCIIVERILPKPINRIVPYVLLFVLWFISAFRYNIGNDYGSYIEMFYSTNMEDIHPEVTFRILSVWLRENGFDYQMLFLVYSTFTYIFLWLSIKKYIEDTSTRMIALVLYAFTFPLMWYSFSIVRQSLAMVIFLYAIDYIYSRDMKKYFLCIFCAASIHFSSILLIVFYWMPREKKKFKFYLGILFASICVHYLNVLPKLIEFILGFLGLDMYSWYLENESSNSFYRLSNIYEMVVFLICVYYSENIKKNFINIYAMYIIGVVIFSFSSILSRFNYFSEIIYIIILSKTITKFNLKYKTKFAYLILIPIFLILFQCMQSDAENPINKILQGLSVGNYQYEFNFKLFK